MQHENIQPTSRTSARKLGILLAFLLVVYLVVLSYCTPFWTQLRYAFVARENTLPSPQEALKGNDPVVGMVFPKNALQNQIFTKSVKSEHILLVSVGACTECAAIDYPAWKQWSQQYSTPVILFSGSAPKEIALFLKQNHIPLPMLHDENNALARALSATWAGQVYLFSARDQKLHWFSDATYRGRKPKDFNGLNQHFQ